MQTMAAQLGGTVEGSTVREFGYAEVRARGPLEAARRHPGPAQRRTAWAARRLDEPRRQGHRAAARVQAIASDASCAIAGMADEARKLYGVQFHPEVTHTKQGGAILERFVREICGCACGLEHARLRRRGGRAHPGAGRQGRGRAWSFRRRRFFGRGSADPPRDRRSAHVHLRRHRTAAAKRGRAGHGDLCPQSRRQGQHGRRVRPSSWMRSPASAIPRRSARSSDASSCMSSRRRRRSFRKRSGWRKARSIPT